MPLPNHTCFQAVATVKANAGSYSAALKAVGQGKTVIEIKSKVTKAVIARYELEVSTVGDAYRSRNNPIFFGDNRFLRFFGNFSLKFRRHGHIVLGLLGQTVYPVLDRCRRRITASNQH